LVVSVCHVSIFGRRSVGRSFLRSRAAPTWPKSEKPRKSREGKRSKRLKRQQQERKEKHRKRQCRANHEQYHQLSKRSATHDVQHQRSGKKFHHGPFQIAPIPRRRNDAIQIVSRIRLRWVSVIFWEKWFSYRPQSSSAWRFTSGATNRRSRRIEARYSEYRSQWTFPSSSPTLAIWTNSSSEHPRAHLSHCCFLPKSRAHASVPAITIWPLRAFTPALMPSVSLLLGSDVRCRQSSKCLQMFFGLLHAA
jgi:hypothetical protein